MDSDYLVLLLEKFDLIERLNLNRLKKLLFLGIIAGISAFYLSSFQNLIWKTLGYTDKSYTLFVAPITEEIFKIGIVLLLNSILLIIFKKKIERKTTFSEEKNLIFFSALIFGTVEGIFYTIFRNQGILEIIIRMIGHPVFSSSYILLRMRIQGKKSYLLSFIPAIILHFIFNSFGEFERIFKFNGELTIVLQGLALIFLSIFEYHLFKKFTASNEILNAKKTT